MIIISYLWWIIQKVPTIFLDKNFPVHLSVSQDGRTYCRSAIERCILQGNCDFIFCNSELIVCVLCRLMYRLRNMSIFVAYFYEDLKQQGITIITPFTLHAQATASCMPLYFLTFGRRWRKLCKSLLCGEKQSWFLLSIANELFEINFKVIVLVVLFVYYMKPASNMASASNWNVKPHCLTFDMICQSYYTVIPNIYWERDRISKAFHMWSM